ncbi:MAG: metallophosphoesterase [Trichococcus flocculiformis]|uniref:Metallophosphoesterase n=1 Tax=Trichococcus flocculiformis TaxID=82803 RepID=A0A847D1C9_9LACT|nr:metallophosphoesterase [Trichococcus flocculiformis]NLD31141.1 metallophosphoesterase [Trichococcus flocculiformis]
MNIKNKSLLKSAVLAGTAAYLHLQNTWIQKTEYTIPVKNLAPENEGLKIVQLSDIHLPKEKVDLNKLIDMTKAADPDFIFLTGDQIQGDGTFDPLVAEKLFRKLTAIAPTYAITGNHDRHSPMFTIVLDLYKQTGIRFLDDEAISVLAKGRKPVVIMGLSDKSSAIRKIAKDFLKKIRLRKDWQGQTRLLLAHRPEHFLKYHIDPEKSADITFAGHAHGGQIRIPRLGGLYAPGQGQMPRHTEGVYLLPTDPEKKLVVSRGIGGSLFPFRINNRPEMVVVTLTNGSTSESLEI